MFAADYPQAMAFLQAQPLRHLVHLKFLHLYPEAITGIYCQAGSEIGLILQHATGLRARDAAEYPDTGTIFLPVATGAAASQTLLAHILNQSPMSSRQVFKFCDSLTRDSFVEALRLQYANTVISYTITPSQNRPVADQAVITATALDDACAQLYTRNGYSRGELDHYFADGALSFSIYEAGQSVCTCIVYRNFGDVWEIAGLHTVETERRKGYGRRVVQAALDRLLAQGYTPRYQVETANTASIQLAETLDLTCCLRFEHYLSPAGNH